MLANNYFIIVGTVWLIHSKSPYSHCIQKKNSFLRWRFFIPIFKKVKPLTPWCQIDPKRSLTNCCRFPAVMHCTYSKDPFCLDTWLVKQKKEGWFLLWKPSTRSLLCKQVFDLHHDFIDDRLLFFPQPFLWIPPRTTILLSIIMFCMGMTLNVAAFKMVVLQPKAFILGVLFQFTISPLVAYGLAQLFGLSSSLIIGFVLLGCVSGGTASNVMTFIGKGDVALTVSMTTVSTLLATVVTPFLVYVLAGQYTEISFWEMLLSVLQMVLLPIILGDRPQTHCQAHRAISAIICVDFFRQYLIDRCRNCRSQRRRHRPIWLDRDFLSLAP